MVAPLPTGDIHSFWSERAFGTRCEATHRLIDSWSSILGSKHRIYFHDPVSAILVADRADGPQCRAAAVNHLYVDQAYEDPSTKIMLEMIRLTETVPQEPAAPGMSPVPSRYGKCRVRR